MNASSTLSLSEKLVKKRFGDKEKFNVEKLLPGITLA